MSDNPGGEKKANDNTQACHPPWLHPLKAQQGKRPQWLRVQREPRESGRENDA
jgi:hypothetical protein